MHVLSPLEGMSDAAPWSPQSPQIRLSSVLCLYRKLRAKQNVLHFFVTPDIPEMTCNRGAMGSGELWHLRIVKPFKEPIMTALRHHRHLHPWRTDWSVNWPAVGSLRSRNRRQASSCRFPDSTSFLIQNFITWASGLFAACRKKENCQERLMTYASVCGQL